MVSSVSRFHGARRRLWHGLAMAMLATQLAACASTAGLQEFRSYRTAFDNANAASDQILDELAIAEREAAHRLIAAGRDPVAAQPPATPTSRTAASTIKSVGFDQQFYLIDVPYQTDLVDPPGTAAIRRSLRAVAHFNDTVLAYGEGRGLDELKANASLVATQSAGAATAVAAALGSTIALPGLPAALGLLNEGMDLALQAASRAAFRDAVVAHQPDVEAILAGVRDTAPTVFSLLTRNIADTAKDLRDEGRQAEADAAVARLEGYRKLLSSWVVMLDQSRAALAAAVSAIQSPDQAMALADFAQGAADLRVRAARIEQLFVELRRGAPQG